FGVSSNNAVVSNDADFIGTLPDANELAARLNAKLIKPRQSARTALVAQIKMKASRGREANIDVLHQLFTLGPLSERVVFTRRVVARSVRAQWSEGVIIRVMDPFDLLEARIQNAAGLYEDRFKGPHVVTQAQWALEVGKAALFTIASGRGPAAERLGRRIQQLYKLATSRPGRTVYQLHGIDVLEAIDADLLEAIAPGCAPQLLAVRQEQWRRQTGMTTPPNSDASPSPA
ncbi:hypothetical protein, partial [Roseateles sp.]|uniref:hypothetical protein n=1 Tax=Roseateles sp. TaxID=1971397 RepID=UPI0031D2ADC9